MEGVSKIIKIASRHLWTTPNTSYIFSRIDEKNSKDEKKKKPDNLKEIQVKQMFFFKSKKNARS